jgi:uncharacterized protein YdhG (YjbR/CyaY superfamily)
MQSTASTPQEYLNSLPEDRKLAIEKLRKAILENLPKGFHEEMSYGMLGYVVPHTIYPNGYHCNPKLPLSFMALASQKNFIALYHMGIYANPELLNWFTTEFSKHSKLKLDMGKSCIRFKNMNDIPYALIGELASKVTVELWIEWYESNFIKA